MYSSQSTAPKRYVTLGSRMHVFHSSTSFCASKTYQRRETIASTSHPPPTGEWQLTADTSFLGPGAVNWHAVASQWRCCVSCRHQKQMCPVVQHARSG